MNFKKTKRNRTKRNRTIRNRTKRNRTKRNRTNLNRTKRNRTKLNRTKRNRTIRNRRIKHKRKARGDIPPQHSCFSCAKEFEQGETRYMYKECPYCDSCAKLIIPELFEKKENENKCIVCKNIINKEDMFDVTTHNHKGKILLAHKQCLSSALDE